MAAGAQPASATACAPRTSAKPGPASTTSSSPSGAALTVSEGQAAVPSGQARGSARGSLTSAPAGRAKSRLTSVPAVLRARQRARAETPREPRPLELIQSSLVNVKLPPPLLVQLPLPSLYVQVQVPLAPRISSGPEAPVRLLETAKLSPLTSIRNTASPPMP